METGGGGRQAMDFQQMRQEGADVGAGSLEALCWEEVPLISIQDVARHFSGLWRHAAGDMFATMCTFWVGEDLFEAYNFL